MNYQQIKLLENYNSRAFIVILSCFDGKFKFEKKNPFEYSINQKTSRQKICSVKQVPMNQSRSIDFSQLPAISGVLAFLPHSHYCVKNSRLKKSQIKWERKAVASTVLLNQIENASIDRAMNIKTRRTSTSLTKKSFRVQIERVRKEKE